MSKKKNEISIYDKKILSLDVAMVVMGSLIVAQVILFAYAMIKG